MTVRDSARLSLATPISPDDRARFARYAEATAFHGGDQWITRRQRGETRLTMNYARSLVRKVASYVFPDTVTFSVPAPGREALGNLAERLLAETIEENDLAQLDVALCIDASVLGDAAMKVTWNAVKGRPAVAAVDPATLTAAWAPDNPRELTGITQRYQLNGEQIGEILGFAGGIGGVDLDQAYPVVEIWTDRRWRVEIADQLVRDDANPYGWIPYVIAANDARPYDYWGQSDLTDLFEVCRELNGRLSVLARVLELSGAPIAVLENVDSSEGITIGPGAKWELPEGAKAYLLDLLAGGGASLHIDYVNLLYRTLHDLSETPRTAFGDSGRTLSGAALEVEIQPLIQKVHRKRAGWNAVYRQRNARLLDLIERFGGHDLGGLRRTVAIWPSILPSETDSEVRNAVQLVESGVLSRRTAIARLGGADPEAEQALVLGERNAFGGGK